jgi:hypothetical protein
MKEPDIAQALREDSPDVAAISFLSTTTEPVRTDHEADIFGIGHSFSTSYESTTLPRLGKLV